MRTFRIFILSLFIINFLLVIPGTARTLTDVQIGNKVNELLGKMTLKEKVGQMMQYSYWGSSGGKGQEAALRQGLVGSFLNVESIADKNRLQKIAVEQTRLGIPIIFGRDVIHGFRTIIPIPLGQAASWNPQLIEAGAALAAREARAIGVHWTFAPMLDICRDPRWGRIAEGLGEDPYLTSQLGAAMVRGFQGNDYSAPDRIAACAKHYVAYGAAEGGRDYNTTAVSERQLREIYLPPFRAAVDAGVATIMSAFNEIDGIPASGNQFTLRTILRNEWQFKGFVVSDWTSLTEMINHGFCADEKEVALKSITAGVDMEMVSESYIHHLENLLNEKQITSELIDESVRNILQIKFKTGLFDNPYTPEGGEKALLTPENQNVAQEIARQSLVLLKNEKNLLPLAKNLKRIAVIGPMANAPHDQLGCWSMDGRKENTITPLKAIQNYVGKETEVLFTEGLKTSRTTDTDGFDQAFKYASIADVVLLFVGEESILSGEAHSRAFLELPGAQEKLIEAVAKLNKPTVMVILAGRPLTFHQVAEKVGAILYAWHPGTMGGPAIADVLFGNYAPSGKLPVSFPKTVGQIPVYYAHKNTGRPPSPNQKGIPMGTPLDPVAFVSNYLDVDVTPEYPFGYGLSYTNFEYSNLKLSTDKLKMGEILEISVQVKNSGQMAADEIVQLYIRDLAASVTRPVKELRGFKRITLKPGESQIVNFKLQTNDLAFYNQQMKMVTEPGKFQLWVGKNSAEGLQTEFWIAE